MGVSRVDMLYVGVDILTSGRVYVLTYGRVYVLTYGRVLSESALLHSLDLYCTGSSLASQSLFSSSHWTMVKRYNHQNYEKLRRRAQAAGRLFEDPQFPAAWDSLYLDGHENARIEWKRPGVVLEFTSTLSLQ